MSLIQSDCRFRPVSIRWQLQNQSLSRRHCRQCRVHLPVCRCKVLSSRFHLVACTFFQKSAALSRQLRPYGNQPLRNQFEFMTNEISLYVCLIIRILIQIPIQACVQLKSELHQKPSNGGYRCKALPKKASVNTKVVST